MTTGAHHITEALTVLIALGLPRAQRNERSALSLLALLNLTPDKTWEQAEAPLIGITPIMDWAREHDGKDYAPNTRETVRRQTMHQFVDAGIALYNPDNVMRPVNSPKAVYQIEPAALILLRTFGSAAWHAQLTAYLADRETLAEKYAMVREQSRIPVQIAPGKEITLSPGEHSELIRAIIEEFAPRSVLVYAGDTGDKWEYFDAPLLFELGVAVDLHGKMPDVVLRPRRSRPVRFLGGNRARHVYRWTGERGHGFEQAEGDLLVMLDHGLLADPIERRQGSPWVSRTIQAIPPSRPGPDPLVARPLSGRPKNRPGRPPWVGSAARALGAGGYPAGTGYLRAGCPGPAASPAVGRHPGRSRTRISCPHGWLQVQPWARKGVVDC